MIEAAKIASPGDAVVLSPGAESFGEFKDYRERGEKFKNLISEF
jgi:UDP-N-acetylmuramoylalanine--D-glutamate ligase